METKEIKLNTIIDVYNFTKICSSYIDFDIYVSQKDKYAVNGKSILGIFGLNLLRPINVHMMSKDKTSISKFFNDIKKWEVKNNY